MPKFKLVALISGIALMGVIFYGLVGFSQSPQSMVRLKTEPLISQIAPFEAEATTPPLGSGKVQPPVLLKLLAVDAQNHPLENAKVHLQIFTPPKNSWFTTDFPIVEGTKLLDIEGNAPNGQLQVQQLLPIRGTYQLLVDVTPIVADAFVPIQQTLALTVPENPLKYRNFGILIVILLVVGLGGGLVIGGRQKIHLGEIAPQRVRLLLSGTILVAIATLLAVNISAEIAESGMSMPMSQMSEQKPPTDNSGMVQSQGLEVRLSGDVSATVGIPANLQVKVIDTQTNQPATDVSLKIRTTQLENNWVAFAYVGVPDATGQLAWQQQFFDGAPHQIEVEVSPQPNAAHQFSPFRVKREVKVEGVAPPLRVRFTSLAYFTGIIVIGLVFGLGLKRRWLQLLEPT